MKSLPIILYSSQRSRLHERESRAQYGFPPINYNYQTRGEAPARAVTANRPASIDHAAQMRSFRQLSSAVTGATSRGQFIAEAIVFGVIVALVAWPIISMLIVLAQTARG